MSAPLTGVRVLDFTRALAGPYATMTLADLGADVVKVERPGGGDETRGWGPPFVEGVSTYFLAVNRGKRSVVLDLKDPEGQARARELALAADVVIENFRPGVMAKLGLDAATLRADKPALIFCSISGFGQDSQLPGYDVVLQGMGGITSLTGPIDGEPFKCGTSTADLVAGQNAAMGILAALVRRGSTGEGATIDNSLIDGQRSFLVYHASAWLNAGKAPDRLGNQHPNVHPLCAYKAADGWINLAVGNNKLWSAFCGAIGRDELIEDPAYRDNADRVRNREALNDALAGTLVTRTVADWVARIQAVGVPVGPIHTVPQALEGATLVSHAHPRGGPDVRSVPLPFALSGAPRAAARRAPELDEHRQEVLSEWL